MSSLRRATSLVFVCYGLGEENNAPEALERRALRGGGGAEGGDLGTQVSPSCHPRVRLSALAAVRGRASWPGTNNLPVARQRRATGRLVTTSARAGVAGRTESPAAPRFVDVARQPSRCCQGNEGRLFPCLKGAGASPRSREKTRELQGEKTVPSNHGDSQWIWRLG